MMQVEAIKQSDLTQSEREVLKEDAARWKRMGAGSHLDDSAELFPRGGNPAPAGDAAGVH